MAFSLAEHCVYTIVSADRLADAEERGGAVTFREARPWVTGLALWNQAQNAGLKMPVLLGDASKTNRLLCWGVLTNVKLSKGGTEFTVDRIRRLPRGHTPQELVLRSSGKRIAPNFIRPYAICRTPKFVAE